MTRQHHKPLPTRRQFILRLFRQTAFAWAVIGGALLIGACGYHYLVDLPWLDATLNASMILAGMGPIDPIKTDAGKVFATCYALFSGIIFITVAALLVAPVLHRFLHRLHLDMHHEESAPDNDNSQKQRTAEPQNKEPQNR